MVTPPACRTGAPERPGPPVIHVLYLTGIKENGPFLNALYFGKGIVRTVLQ